MSYLQYSPNPMDPMEATRATRDDCTNQQKSSGRTGLCAGRYCNIPHTPVRRLADHNSCETTPIITPGPNPTQTCWIYGQGKQQKGLSVLGLPMICNNIRIAGDPIPILLVLPFSTLTHLCSARRQGLPFQNFVDSAPKSNQAMDFGANIVTLLL